MNDSGPQQQQMQHPSNHNLMGSMCGPGNNIMSMSNHGGGSGGPMGPGMLMNSNNSNPFMMGGFSFIISQQNIPQDIPNSLLNIPVLLHLYNSLSSSTLNILKII